MGGLGNQMFQYALGRTLSLKNNIPFKIDISDYKIKDYIREYTLDKFNIQTTTASDDDIRLFINNYSNNNYLTKIIKKFKLKVEKNAVEENKNFYKEKYFFYDPSVLEFSDNKYLQGYWQNEKYFFDIKDFLKKEFTLKKPLSEPSEIIRKRIIDNNSVGVHIRRGDYISNSKTNKIHGVCPLEYYYGGLKILKSKISKDFTCFVFSDDIIWCKNNFTPDNPVFFMDVNKDYEEIILMSFCKHFIIANSSFSWWGAWLSDNKNKVVISPKNWFNTLSTDKYEIVPKDWIKI